MKKIILLFVIGCTFAYGQETKKETEAVKTKMDVFASKTGTIIKFTDYKLPDLKGGYSTVAETRIRKISSGTINGFFYQIEKEGKYGSSVASIEYTDLLEIIKALKALKPEAEKDITSTDYIENKFNTVDGVQLGYYISKGKANWYIKLEKYGSDNTFFINDVTEIETALNEAKLKIEELKK